jgi:signal transduction histidine kinase
MLESTLERADKVLNEGRERVRDLRSENDKDEDLEKCLQALSEELGQGRSALCRVTSEGKCRPLHPVVREEFEAIAREAMYNAFLHSQATEIVCEVEYGKRYFRFVCRDNGVGIDPQILSLGGRSGHWGLKGMRERAKKIGATLQMQSGPNGGTRLELKLRARVAFAPGLRRSPWRLLRQKLGLE